jgi:cell wall-associated NlpC family hydrolase
MNYRTLLNHNLSTALLFAALAFCAPVRCAPPATTEKPSIPAHAVPGVEEAQLDADFWIAKLAEPDRVLVDAATMAARNMKLLHADKSMHDLAALPATLTREQVRVWISALSTRPEHVLYDSAGTALDARAIDALVDSLAVDAIADQQPTRYGLVVHRADLRTFPTTRRVFTERGDIDIDRFQETALFPGTPVAIAHQSRDGQWWFVISPRYAAWIEKKYVAEGSADQVLGYASREPYRIVTGASATTVMTPELPAASELHLDMGVRLPVLSDWHPAQPVNGQHPYTAHVIELPLREPSGKLAFAPALLQKNADTQANYLPLTPANILRQAFKFLGERYGWGNDYDARDCSGFVSDVYRSMGVDMPRNTRDQSVSPAFEHRLFGNSDDRAARVKAARALEVGDLVYIPGHVMMMIGSIGGEPYVIHDTTGLSYRRDDGSKARVRLNEVSVSPLLPLLFGDTQTYVDRMTSIVRIRSAAASTGN